METQGLTKEQMLSVLAGLSDEKLREILSYIDVNSDEDTQVQASDVAYEEIQEPQDDFDYEIEPESNNLMLSIDAFRSRYVEITEYLISYPCTPELKEELRQLSQGLYDLYQTVNDKLTQYKIVVYQKYINKMYEEERVPISPYAEIASEFAHYFLDEAMDREWFRKYVNCRTLDEYRRKKEEEPEYARGKRQKLLAPIEVDCARVDEYLAVLKDYAFNSRYLYTTNDGDRAVFLVTDSICGSFLNHEDREGYLAEGIRYYLGDMRSYRKGL